MIEVEEGLKKTRKGFLQRRNWYTSVWADPPHKDTTHCASPTGPIVDVDGGEGKGPQLPHEAASVEQKEEGAPVGCLGEPAAAVVCTAVKEGVRRTAPERPIAAATVRGQRPRLR